MSDTICILPFIHFYTQPDGEVKPCCIADGFDERQFLSEKSIEDIWNSDQYKQLRKDMLEGKRNKVCDVCYRKEDLGEHSPRHMFNENTLWTMPEVNEDFSVDTQFQHIDVRFSNRCNFKCRMCTHTFSSRWYDDEEQVNSLFHKKDHKKVLVASDTIIDDLLPHLDEIKSVYFAGGEPLTMPEHYELLTWLYDTLPFEEIGDKQLKPLSIHYNTNLSTLKYNEDDLLKYWKSFRRIQLAISCDGIGEVGEYQRVGFSHKNFIKNLNQIKELAKPLSIQTENNGDGEFWYSFQYTTTIFNIHHIFEFIDFMKENQYIKHTDTIDFFYAWQPQYFAINNLSDLQKETYNKMFYEKIPTLKSEKTKNQLLSLQKFMNNDRTMDLDDVRDKVVVLDKINNTDYRNNIPLII